MWSREHEKCLGCKTMEVKHKGRGFCRHCHDKLRAKKPHRVKLRRKIAREWARKNKDNVDKNREIWYEKRKEILCVIQRGRYAKMTGKPVLQIYNRHVPMDIMKDMTLFDKVRSYIERNQKLVGKKNDLIIG